MLKFSKIISSKSKSIVKEDSEYIRIFHLLKWMFLNQLIIWRTCVEMAKVLRFINAESSLEASVKFLNIRACFHECPLGHYFFFPHPNSWGLYAKNSETHWLFLGPPLPPPHLPLFLDLETPTRLTKARHLTSKTGFTSAKIFWLGLSFADCLHLKLVGEDSFKVGWEIVNW
jgi:hypothetical protein